MGAKEVLRMVNNKRSLDVYSDPVKTPSLRANFIWTLVGNNLYAASQWGILILLSKLGTTEIVGKFALALAITAPVILFSNLALRSVQVTDASRSYEFGHYLALRLVTTSAAFLIIAGIVIVMRYPGDTSLVILMVGLAKSFESISDVIYGLLQQHEWMDKTSISMILKSFLSFLGVAAGLYLGKSLFWGAFGLAVAWGLTLVTYDLLVGKKLLELEEDPAVVVKRSRWLKPLWNWDQTFRLARVSLPLGIAACLISLNLNIPRYFLERSFGENSLGIFAALAYPLVAGTLVINALGQSASPRLAKYFESGDVRKFWNLLFALTGLGLLIGLAGIVLVLLFGQQILGVIYQAEYAKYAREFLWLMLAAGIEFTFSFMGYGMTAAHYFKIQPVIYFISVTLSIGLGFLLIPVSGILGAIQVTLITTCFRSIAMLGVNIYAIRKRSGFSFKKFNQYS
jgi:O-antigen/teichoic acid export membrane protein